MKPTYFTKVIRRIFCLAAATMALQAHVSSAIAEWKPTKPIEIVVPSGAGGGFDRAARAIQRILQTENLVPTPVVVVNKGGAGGALAYQYLRNHPGDGHYLAISVPNLITSYLLGQSSVKPADLTPIATLYGESAVFVVKNDSPLKSAADLLQQLRKTPTSLTIGVAPSLGSANHLALVVPLKAGGVDIKKLKTVVFKSSGESMTAVAGKHVDVVVVAGSNAIPLAKAGDVRVIATSGAERTGAPFEAVPTWKELGVNGAFSNWRGVVAPQGLPEEQTKFWNSTFEKLANSEKWKAEVAIDLWDLDYKDNKASATFLAVELEQLRTTLAELGLIKSQ